MNESSAPEDLDETDRHLLHLLQSDGRISNADLARKAKLSPATCHRRTQRLFDEGYVKSVRAFVAPEKVSRSTLVFVGVVLDRSTPESFSNFNASVVQLPFVIDCHVVAGDFDYFLKIRVADIKEFNHLHATELLRLPAVRQTRTFFVLDEVIDNAPLVF